MPRYFLRVAMPPRIWRWALFTSSTSLTCKYSARLKRGSRSEISLWTVDLLHPNARAAAKQQFQHKNSHQTIHFKQAARQAKERTGYLHKCCVCGRTDADYPDLEFRYCSKCAGYRCYCMDHINNHVHVTEE